MAKKLTIRHADVFSVAKFVGIVNVVIALVVGLIAALATIVGIIASGQYEFWQALGISVAAISVGILLYPALMFVFGWVYGALASLIFNLFVGVSGGITFRVDEER